uniref:Serine hydroxymethyltransferase-like domain-containing protein n=1 Tax=candidate division WOR-3 bacterium TaxID=2052148 RepID=A0A7C3UVA2_UNCW3
MFSEELKGLTRRCFEAIRLETEMEQKTLELIASENFCFRFGLAQNKYAEVRPKKRYYGGCGFVDMREQLAIERLKQLFGCEHANLQPHSVNFPRKYFKVVNYALDSNTEVINYEELWKMAKEHKPKIIVSRASAYPRTLYFAKFQEICEDVGAYQVADIAGLVAAGLHPSPIPHSCVVPTTTHKTLRGPRGTAIMCKVKYAELIDKTTFPGIKK